MGDETAQPGTLLDLTVGVVSAYVSANPVPLVELPGLIAKVHIALSGVASGPATAGQTPQKPAVPIRKSITPDFLISLEDGRKFKSLKLHLATQHGMTPAEYRAKWGLPADYPMVSPNYAAERSASAKRAGLGRQVKVPAAKTRSRSKPEKR